MLPPIPRLEDYDISTQHGFLPPEPPLEFLSHPYYRKWESTVANLQALLLSKRLREVVRKLPIITASRLRHEAEWRRAYVLLSFIIHAYIWGGDRPEEIVPPSVSIPFKQICEHLELPTVATYSGFCLWNWRTIFDGEPIDTLDNLSTLTTFTGSLDESWFYLVSVAIEARGGPLIPLMLRAVAAAREDDKLTVIECLRRCAEKVDELGALLLQMYENCDPHVFYHRIRPFLAGGKNMAEAGLPNGVLFDTGSSTDRFCQYGGGSNAQSSLIQFFDVILGVEHRPTGTRQKPNDSACSSTESEAEGATATAPPGPRHNFIHEMRSYMPGPHRRFLSDVTAVANIREYVEARRHDRNLTIAYDACLTMLRGLRDKHMQMVTRYIIVQSHHHHHNHRSLSPRAAPHNPPVAAPDSSHPQASQRKQSLSRHQSAPARDDLHPTQQPTRKKKLRGTGGTALIPFLKQARDETGESAIDDWFRRTLGTSSSSTSTFGDSKPYASRDVRGTASSTAAFGDSRVASLGKLGEHADGELEIVGLSGVWTMDDTFEGGICHW